MLLYALLGLAVGSFANVVIDRVPEGRSLLRPASHCPACGRRLSPWELVPLVSYLVLRGRCRTCAAPIPVRVPAVELGYVAAYALLWRLIGPSARLAPVTFFSSVLLAILVIDLERRLVPNAIVLPALAIGLLLSPLWSLGGAPPYAHVGLLALLHPALAQLSPLAQSVISQALGALVAFGVFWLIWLVAPAAMGAGDVKLAALAGLATAFPGAVAAVFGSFVLGGAVGAALLISGRAGRKTAVPFAPFLVITTLVVMVRGDALLTWYLGG